MKRIPPGAEMDPVPRKTANHRVMSSVNPHTPPMSNDKQGNVTIKYSSNDNDGRNKTEIFTYLHLKLWKLMFGQASSIYLKLRAIPGALYMILWVIIWNNEI